MGREHTLPRQAGPEEAAAAGETGPGAAAPVETRGRRVVIDPAYADDSLARLLSNPDRYFDGAYSRILKTDATTSVCVTRAGARRVVIKRYNIRGPWHAASRALRGTRAARCWRLARAMRSHGIPVAPPLAYMEERLGPLRGRAWLVSLHRDGEDLERFLASHRHDEAGERVIRAVVELFGQLARHRYSHGDMKATNVLVDRDTLWLIDLDAARAHRSLRAARMALARDIERFLRNWNEHPELEARFRSALSPIASGRAPS